MPVLESIVLPVPTAPTTAPAAALPDQDGPQDVPAAPGALREIRNVSIPTLTPVLPDPTIATGTAVVVAPGGSFHFLAIENEGLLVAQRLAEVGVAAFVLTYRVHPTPVEDSEWATFATTQLADPAYMLGVAESLWHQMADDGANAVALVRERSGEFGVDPSRVGLMGFSAGGYLAIATVSQAGPAGRPDFLLPIYPALRHAPTIPAPLPPLFLAWASDDPLGPVIVESALTLYRTWWEAGASVEAHAYPDGGHGFGITPHGSSSDRWFDDAVDWLRRWGLLTRP